jgi:hypothetical protein
MLPETMPTDLDEQMALVITAIKDQETRISALETKTDTDTAGTTDTSVIADVAQLKTDVAELQANVEAPKVA